MPNSLGSVASWYALTPQLLTAHLLDVRAHMNRGSSTQRRPLLQDSGVDEPRALLKHQHRQARQEHHLASKSSRPSSQRPPVLSYHDTQQCEYSRTAVGFGAHGGSAIWNICPISRTGRHLTPRGSPNLRQIYDPGYTAYWCERWAAGWAILHCSGLAYQAAQL